MQNSPWHHKLFHFHLSFWIWKKWKEGKKLQKFEYLKNEKGFLDEIKNIIFEGLSFGEKIKNSGQKLAFKMEVWMEREKRAPKNSNIFRVCTAFTI